MRFREEQRCRRLLSLLAAVASLFACDRLSGLIPGAEPSPPVVGAPALQDPIPRSEPVPPGLEAAVIEIAGDRVTLRARQAPRVRLLQKLGERVGFKLVADPIEPKEISVDLVAVRLEDAVGACLPDVPYALSYEPDPQADAPRLTLVRVGRGEHFAERAKRRREALAQARERMPLGRDGPELTPEQRQRREERLARFRERRKAADERASERRSEVRKARRPELPEELGDPEELLADPDPEVRGRAVGRIPPENEGLEQLQTILAGDMDPGVRAAAAYRLAGADSVGAARSLIAALADPEPEVVLAAIDTLEFLQDPSLIPDLEPLLGHSDQEVRAAAEEAIDFLR